MKTIFSLILVTLSLSTFAKESACNVFIKNKHGIEVNVKNHVTNYELEGLLLDRGYDIVDHKEDADFTVKFELGEIQYCYDGDVSNFGLLVDGLLTNRYSVGISVEKRDGKRNYISKEIYKILTERKLKRKYRKMIKKLPTCNK